MMTVYGKIKSFFRRQKSEAKQPEPAVKAAAEKGPEATEKKAGEAG